MEKRFHGLNSAQPRLAFSRLNFTVKRRSTDEHLRAKKEMWIKRVVFSYFSILFFQVGTGLVRNGNDLNGSSRMNEKGDCLGKRRRRGPPERVAKRQNHQSLPILHCWILVYRRSQGGLPLFETRLRMMRAPYSARCFLCHFSRPRQDLPRKRSRGSNSCLCRPLDSAAMRLG